jgi:hypothetical protein
MNQKLKQDVRTKEQPHFSEGWLWEFPMKRMLKNMIVIILVVLMIPLGLQHSIDVEDDPILHYRSSSVRYAVSVQCPPNITYETIVPIPITKNGSNAPLLDELSITGSNRTQVEIIDTEFGPGLRIVSDSYVTVKALLKIEYCEEETNETEQDSIYSNFPRMTLSMSNISTRWQGDEGYYNSTTGANNTQEFIESMYSANASDDGRCGSALCYLNSSDVRVSLSLMRESIYWASEFRDWGDSGGGDVIWSIRLVDLKSGWGWYPIYSAIGVYW